jgi:hypothetical protein
MAITTIAGANDALPGQRWVWRKSTTIQAGGLYSSWTVAGEPGQGAAPSSGLGGDIPTKATAGAPNFVNPGSGNTYLAGVDALIRQSSTEGINYLAVYDRLWQNSGINVTIATGQTINSTALTRPNANGADVEAWWEVYATMGAGTPTVTLAYTDQDNNAETTGSSGALSSAMGLGRCGPFNLAAGDTGVRSIQTWTASATFTSGTIGLVLRRLVTGIYSLPSTLVRFDALAVGLPRIYDDACLELLFNTNSTNPITGYASFGMIQG